MLIAKIQANLTKYINRRLVIAIIGGLIVLFFLSLIRASFDKNIVLVFFSQIPVNKLTIAVFGISCIVILILFYHSLTTNKKVSNWVFFLFLFLFCFFAYYRYSGNYEFVPYGRTNDVKYIDLCFVLFCYIFFLKLKDWIVREKGPKYFKDPFHLDLPVSHSDNDHYNRKKFAFDLAIKIQSKIENKNPGSLAIGINGEWGSGKTSFSNFIKEKIDKKNRVVIDFNPWRSSTSDKIIEDFFELLIEEVKKFDPTLSAEVTRYAKTLTKIDENAITKGVETVSDFFFDGENKNKNYELINSCIQRCKKQIIIFIDDLDRLDKREILETLRLIRNTANFNNIVYVVCYDKEYVLEAVKVFNKHNYKNFLEKIFQFEFLLPKYDTAILRNSIKDILRTSFGPTFNPYIDASVDYAGNSGKNITNRIIKTQRDVIRFTNSFLFEIKRVKNEVNFLDFYFVQLLKAKFPAVYKFTSDNVDLLFIKDNKKLRLRTIEEKNYNDEHLNMLRILDESRENKNQKKVENTLLEEYVRRNTSNGLSTIEKDVIIDIINELLTEKYLRDESESIDYKSFVFISNFHKYFSIQLLETDFSSYDFENARFEDFANYERKVLEWIKQGRISDIQDRLEKIIDFNSKHEWENHLRLLITIGKYQFKESGPYGINYVQILETLNFPNKNRKKLKFFDSQENYLTYVRDLFEQAPDPYVFESSLLTTALSRYVTIALPVEEIYKFLLSYLRMYCNRHKAVTSELRELHRNCLVKSQSYYTEYNIEQEAENLFKDHLRKYITGSQLAGFIRHTDPGQEYFHIDFEWLSKFFPTWEDFELYLAEADNIKIEYDHYKEFQTFYKKYKDNDRKPVEFYFEYLSPNRWIGG